MFKITFFLNVERKRERKREKERESRSGGFSPFTEIDRVSKVIIVKCDYTNR